MFIEHKWPHPLTNHTVDCRLCVSLHQASHTQKCSVSVATGYTASLNLLFLNNDQAALLTNGRHLPCPSTSGQVRHVTTKQLFQLIHKYIGYSKKEENLQCLESNHPQSINQVFSCKHYDLISRCVSNDIYCF